MEKVNSPNSETDKLPSGSEYESPGNKLHSKEHHEELNGIRENLKQQEDLNTARQAAAELAKSSEKSPLGIEADKSSESAQPRHHYSTTKKMAYKKSMAQMRQKLPKSERYFSKFIHNKTVETVSETAATTIFRPIPLIGAGLAASLVTAIVYFYAKRYGYGIDGSGWFIASFGLGYCAGLLIDFIRLLVIKKQR